MATGGMELRVSVSSEEIRMRLITQLEKLRQKDRQARHVSKDVSSPYHSFPLGSYVLAGRTPFSYLPNLLFRKGFGDCVGR